MDTTVVGVDDSLGARAALAWAAHHAAATGGRLRVVHAYELPVAWIDVYAPELPEWRKRAQRGAETMTEQVVSDVLEPGEREGIEVEVVEANPVDVLHDESLDAAVVVVGSRGARRVRRLAARLSEPASRSARRLPSSDRAITTRGLLAVDLNTSPIWRRLGASCCCCSTARQGGVVVGAKSPQARRGR